MKDSTKKLIKAIFSLIVLITGVVAAIYFGIWVMFIKSILLVGVAFDAGTLTGIGVSWAIIKCLFAKAVTKIILKVTVWVSETLCK